MESEDDEPLDPEAFAQELIDELDSDQRIYLGFYYAKGVFGGLFNSVAAMCTSANGINQFCHVDLIVCSPVSILKPNLMSVMNSDEHPYRNDLLSAGFFDDSYSRRKLQLDSETVQIAFSALWGQKLSCRVLRKSANNSFQREVRDDSDEVVFVPFDISTNQMKVLIIKS